MTTPDRAISRHHRGITRVRFGAFPRERWSWSNAGFHYFIGAVRFIAQNALKKAKAAATA